MLDQELQQQQITTVSTLADEVEQFLRGVSSRAKALEVTVLVLTVLTAGSLWLLISEALPQAALWFGAIASTLTIGITLYIQTFGIGTTRIRALALLKDTEKFLGELRGHAKPEIEFWASYKFLRIRLHDLQYAKHE